MADSEHISHMGCGWAVTGCVFYVTDNVINNQITWYANIEILIVVWLWGCNVHILSHFVGWLTSKWKQLYCTDVSLKLPRHFSKPFLSKLKHHISFFYKQYTAMIKSWHLTYHCKILVETATQPFREALLVVILYSKNQTLDKGIFFYLMHHTNKKEQEKKSERSWKQGGIFLRWARSPWQSQYSLRTAPEKLSYKWRHFPGMLTVNLMLYVSRGGLWIHDIALLATSGQCW